MMMDLHNIPLWIKYILCVNQVYEGVLVSISFTWLDIVSRVQYLGGGGKTFQGIHTALSGRLPNCKSHP